MKAKDVAEKLDKYEQKAYDDGCSNDWLSGIGENIKLFMIYCDKNDTQPTLEGLILWIDKMHEKAQSFARLEEKVLALIKKHDRAATTNLELEEDLSHFLHIIQEERRRVGEIKPALTYRV
ncbi:hypothetical protein HXA34_20160 [Salipaludibacillus agaradhaerens]|jgi:hypothetical protein|uniref:hypothetical protein n=1 Tax=Salipaludibacillus agaradhaerens TaxID=76935 RepID=UPI0021518847|nr:hypothetical protein [Salipaludibacillus agaradhaerens]MCR6108606.1 hypothetical protein [Salipaludibacillus agaradhaerens]MCR6120635.1 hypothetical protein [Salipaludibacillus agaradhaerens]